MNKAIKNDFIFVIKIIKIFKYMQEKLIKTNSIRQN
jgi:hypothetical protein